jgi:TfoX/Sxy family transcriptional regulator of competence genes
MAYDEDLAARIRHEVEGEPGLVEKKMFGGLAFILNGNMSVAASGQGGLMLRCEPARTDDLISAGAEPFVMRGKAMDGWLRVPDERVADDSELEKWIRIGVEYARSLPSK